MTIKVKYPITVKEIIRTWPYGFCIICKKYDEINDLNICKVCIRFSEVL